MLQEAPVQQLTARTGEPEAKSRKTKTGEGGLKSENWIAPSQPSHNQSGEGKQTGGRAD